MTLRDTLRGAMAPVVTMLAAELGDTMTVARQSTTYTADNSPRESYAAVPGLVGVRGTLQQVSARKAAELWGEGSETTALASVPTTTPILRDDIVVITSGHLTGQQFVVDEVQYSEITQAYRLGLRSLSDAVVIA